MKNNFKYIAAGVIIAGSLIFLLFGGGESGNEDQDAAANEDKALTALFGGGGDTAGGSATEGKSVFESDFFKNHSYGRTGDEGAVPGPQDNDILDPVSEGNPINPATGTPYTDSVMKQFEDLAEKFPGNSIIPRRLTEEEKAAQEADRQKLSQLAAAVNKGEASAEDVNFYYDQQAKPVKDRLELLDYVIEKSGASMPEDIKKRYEEVRVMNRTQLENYEKARQAALAESN